MNKIDLFCIKSSPCVNKKRDESGVKLKCQGAAIVWGIILEINNDKLVSTEQLLNLC